MSKKGWKAGAVLAAGAGITAVLAAKKRGNMEMDKMKKTSHGSRYDYRNTELGKHDKNSKGIYYTNGNYEAFARPEKPAGIEEKSAYLVGSGLASLAAACFLVRDAQMPGKNIHILEAMDIAGGACDGIDDPTRGYVMRGGLVVHRFGGALLFDLPTCLEHFAFGCPAQRLLVVRGDIVRIASQHLEGVEPHGLHGDLRAGAARAVQTAGLEVEHDGRIDSLFCLGCCHIIRIS